MKDNNPNNLMNFWFKSKPLAEKFAKVCGRFVQEGNRTGKKNCSDKFFVTTERDIFEASYKALVSAEFSERQGR